VKLVIATVLVSCLYAFPVTAVEQSSAPAAAAETPEPVKTVEKEKKICTNEFKTGSRMPTRTCRTQAQIDSEREQAKDAMRRGQRNMMTPKSGADL
jgi:hypothetical protein